MSEDHIPIRYYPNKGKGKVLRDTIGYGQEYTVEENCYTREQYHFIGWNTRSGGGGTAYAPGDKITNTTLFGDDICLYAQWEHDNVKLTLPAHVEVSSPVEFPDDGIIPYGTKVKLYVDSSCEVFGNKLLINGKPTALKRRACTFTIKENTVVTGDITPQEDKNFPVKIEYCALDLGGEIGVEFFTEAEWESAYFDTMYMHFTVGTSDDFRTLDIRFSSGKERVINGKSYIVFVCPVSASEMTAPIRARIIDEATQSTGPVTEYSVKGYANTIFSSEEYADAQDLIKAMLNYGAYSQRYFGINTGNLANVGHAYSSERLSDITAETINKPYDPSKTDLPEGVTFESVTLSLKAETTLSLYFRSDEKLTFSCTGRTVDYETDGKGLQVARIRDIPPAELGWDFILTVTTAGGASGTVGYSPMTYCYNALNRNKSAELQNVCKALYLYSVEAAKYANKGEQDNE